jgi:hypothetical protein
MRSSLVQGRLGQGPTTSVQPSRSRAYRSLGHASSASRRVYSQIGNPAGSCLTTAQKPSERLIVLAQRNTKTPLLSLWQRDCERRSCIGR